MASYTNSIPWIPFLGIVVAPLAESRNYTASATRTTTPCKYPQNAYGPLKISFLGLSLSLFFFFFSLFIPDYIKLYNVIHLIEYTHYWSHWIHPIYLYSIGIYVLNFFPPTSPFCVCVCRHGASSRILGSCLLSCASAAKHEMQR